MLRAHRTFLMICALAILGCSAVLIAGGCSAQSHGSSAERALAARTITATPSGAAESTDLAMSHVATVAAASTGSALTSPPIVAAKPLRTVTLKPPIAQLPTPTPAGVFKGPRDAGIPVLMYHVIRAAPPGVRNSDLYVTPEEFVAQLRYLIKNGYHAVTLQQVYDFWHSGGTLPSKPVVLSFDDGDTPDVTIVAPLLKEVHWPGVLNLIVGRHKLRFKPWVGRAFVAEGWEIDAHTMTHTDLPGLSASKLKFEVAGSRKELQRLYHVPVNFFCYPSGFHDPAAVAAVQAAGYLGATTTSPGLARPGKPFLMRRLRVLGGASIQSFAARLRGAR